MTSIVRLAALAAVLCFAAACGNLERKPIPREDMPPMESPF